MLFFTDTGTLEYTSLVGVLLGAIAVLWRALQRKDAQIERLLREMRSETKRKQRRPPSADSAE